MCCAQELFERLGKVQETNLGRLEGASHIRAGASDVEADLSLLRSVSAMEAYFFCVDSCLLRGLLIMYLLAKERGCRAVCSVRSFKCHRAAGRRAATHQPNPSTWPWPYLWGGDVLS